MAQNRLAGLIDEETFPEHHAQDGDRQHGFEARTGAFDNPIAPAGQFGENHGEVPPDGTHHDYE